MAGELESDKGARSEKNGARYFSVRKMNFNEMICTMRKLISKPNAIFLCRDLRFVFMFQFDFLPQRYSILPFDALRSAFRILMPLNSAIGVAIISEIIEMQKNQRQRQRKQTGLLSFSLIRRRRAFLAIQWERSFHYKFIAIFKFEYNIFLSIKILLPKQTVRFSSSAPLSCSRRPLGLPRLHLSVCTSPTRSGSSGACNFLNLFRSADSNASAHTDH